MQFEPEESGEDRRRRQRDYHAFLDAQVEARQRALLLEAPSLDGSIDEPVLPFIPKTGMRLKHQPAPPTSNTSNNNAQGVNVGINNNSVSPRTLESRSGAEMRNVMQRCTARDKMLDRLEQRLEIEVQRRQCLEGELAAFGQKMENSMSDAALKIESLGAREAAAGEIRKQAHSMDIELAALREWRAQVEKTLALAPKVQEATQKQLQALEEEARTRIQSDEARALRFRQSIERLSGEVHKIETRWTSEEKGMLQRVANLEVALTGESKGAREATNELRHRIQELANERSGSADNMISLQQTLKLVQSRQQDTRSMFMASREQDEISRKEMQNSLRAATGEQVAALKRSLITELSSLMGGTAKHEVERTGVPQEVSALRGRVEVAEERLSMISDKSFKTLQEELSHLRSEVMRLHHQPEVGPVAATVRELAQRMASTQAAAQTQLTELQDALSAEITARRRNAVRLAEAQAATKEGGRECVVQATANLKSRCFELEEVVKGLTADMRRTQEETSSQTQVKMVRMHERNSKAVGKLEDSLAGERVRALMVEREADLERSLAKGNDRADELEGFINNNKDLLREAEERARNALTAAEARRQLQGQQLSDKVDSVVSQEAVKREELEQAMREQAHGLRESVQAGDRANSSRLEALQEALQSLGQKMHDVLAEALKAERRGVEAILGKAQGQLVRDLDMIRLGTDRAAADGNTMRQRIQAEETARVNEVQSLWHALSGQGDQSEARIRFWTENRLQKERAGTEEALQRAQAHSDIVRALLDEAVKAVTKELGTVRSECRGRDTMLEQVLDERFAVVEERVTQVDSGAAKKRRLSDMGKETGLRFGGVERRLRQAEQDLKDELEVKLTVTSLVCSVTERDSDQRLVDRTAENSHTEALHETKTTVREDDLRAEFDSISALVNKVQIDLAAATGDQKQAIHDLKTDLVGRINELEAMAETVRVEAKAAATQAFSARKQGKSSAAGSEGTDPTRPETNEEVTKLSPSRGELESSLPTTYRDLSGDSELAANPASDEERERVNDESPAREVTTLAKGKDRGQLERYQTSSDTDEPQDDDQSQSEVEEENIESRAQPRQRPTTGDSVSVASTPDESRSDQQDSDDGSSYSGNRDDGEGEEEMSPGYRSDGGNEGGDGSGIGGGYHGGSDTAASQSATEQDDASDDENSFHGRDGESARNGSSTAGSEAENERQDASDAQENGDTDDDDSRDDRSAPSSSKVESGTERGSEHSGDSRDDGSEHDGGSTDDGGNRDGGEMGEEQDRASSRSASRSETGNEQSRGESEDVEGGSSASAEGEDGESDHNSEGSSGRRSSPERTERPGSDASNGHSEASAEDQRSNTSEESDGKRSP